MGNPPHISPPKWPVHLLRMMLKQDYVEEIEGDMEEIFYDYLTHLSVRQAKIRYSWEVFKLLRPILTKKLFSQSPLIHMSMVKHDFIITLRHYLRNKTTFFIHLIGLSTGIACFLLIFLWVRDEFKVDKFHQNDDNLYQVLENVDRGKGIRTGTNTSGPLGTSLVEDMPEVIASVTARTKSINPFTLNTNTKNLKAKGLFASKDFFKLFSFQLIEGSSTQVLTDPTSIVISESLAKRFFGQSKNILGKIIELQHEWPLQISGIFKDPPPHSTLQFDYVLSYEAWAAENTWVNSWRSSHPQTFLLLKPQTHIQAFNTKIKDYLAKQTEDEEAHRQIFVSKFSDQYLYGTYTEGVQNGGRIEYIGLFSSIAFFILLIACINFINLSTANATQRMKEIGIKKSLGARKSSLLIQFLGESIIISTLALGLALLFIYLFLPTFNAITEKQLLLEWHPNLLLAFLGIILFTGFVAGSYPSFYLSRLNPVATLKGKLSQLGEIAWMRKGLVIIQFTLSTVLIVSVWIIYQQIAFTQNQHLGYENENILLFRKEGNLLNVDNSTTFLEEVKRIPGVIQASSMGNTMTESDYGTNSIQWQGKDPHDQTIFDVIQVNYNMMELLEMEMKKGRFFSRSYGADSSKLIFNEAAVKHMGLSDPLGTRISWGRDYEIIGIVKDFHLESFHEEIQPAVFYLGTYGHMVMIKLAANSVPSTISQIESAYQKANPGFTLDYTFLDEDYAALYKSEKRISILSRYFAGLAILISCLGLFGLALFTATKRQKEIGIRKVLGANMVQLIFLLSREYTFMVGLAIVFALPISYVLAQNWLDTFAFSISLQWWYFFGAGILALGIAWCTVSIQTVKVARMNPVASLRDE